MVHDREFARQLRDSLLDVMERDARVIERKRWSHIPWYSRLASWAVYGLVRLLMGWLGMSKRL
jgi:hypothetical protein